MRRWMKRTPTLDKSWATTLSAGLTCLVLSNGCSEKPSASIVIPDRHELREAYVCDHEAQVCQHDLTAVTIDLGYLRDIIDQLDACRKQKI